MSNNFIYILRKKKYKTNNNYDAHNRQTLDDARAILNSAQILLKYEQQMTT